MNGGPYRNHGLSEQVEQLRDGFAHIQNDVEVMKELYTRADALAERRIRMEQIKGRFLLLGGFLGGLALGAHDIQTETAGQVAEVCEFTDAQGGASQDKASSNETVSEAVDGTAGPTIKTAAQASDFALSEFTCCSNSQEDVYTPFCKEPHEPEPIIWLNESFDTVPTFPGDLWIRNYPFTVREEQHPEVKFDLIPIELVE